MSDFYRFKKLDRATNEWRKAKHAVYLAIPEDDRHTAERALATIGRNGYRATKGIDALDLLIGTTRTEAVLKAAANRIAIAKELDVKASDEPRDRWWP